MSSTCSESRFQFEGRLPSGPHRKCVLPGHVRKLKFLNLIACHIGAIIKNEFIEPLVLKGINQMFKSDIYSSTSYFHSNGTYWFRHFQKNHSVLQTGPCLESPSCILSGKKIFYILWIMLERWECRTSCHQRSSRWHLFATTFRVEYCIQGTGFLEDFGVHICAGLFFLP